MDAAAPEAVAVAAVATTGTAGIVVAAEVAADVASAAADVAAAVAAASKPAAYPKCCPWVQACIVELLWVLVMLVVALLSQRFPS